jgi:transcriptional regulator of acetoin/glycerol metabolism
MLSETSGDKLAAAKRMGIHKATLYRKMKQLNIGNQGSGIERANN